MFVINTALDEQVVVSIQAGARWKRRRNRDAERKQNNYQRRRIVPKPCTVQRAEQKTKKQKDNRGLSP